VHLAQEVALLSSDFVVGKAALEVSLAGSIVDEVHAVEIRRPTSPDCQRATRIELLNPQVRERVAPEHSVKKQAIDLPLLDLLLEFAQNAAFDPTEC